MDFQSSKSKQSRKSKLLKKSNPFNTKPNARLVGVKYERKRLIRFIENQNICFLNGPAGVGKSSLLYWIKNNLKSYKVIYIDAKEIDEYFDLKKHLKENTPFLRKFFGKYAKNIVVLIDEAQACSKKLIDNLEALWDAGIIKSVVITQIRPQLTNYSPGFKSRLGDRVIRLGRLNPAKAKRLINLRTNWKHPFTDEAIELIAEKADYIPRKILEICELITMELEDNEEINESDVNRILDRLRAEKLEQEILDLEENTPVNEDVLIPLEKVDSLESISPMEKRILKLLLEGGKTTLQLATILNTSIGSIGKQLSKLTQAGVIETLSDQRPKIYSVSPNFKEELKK